jgi:pyruvate-ferredoxin/flavodoxin oxidoreductase
MKYGTFIMGLYPIKGVHMKSKSYRLAIDGNTAASLASYNFTEFAGIYPITPSSQMAELVDVYASQGKLNYFGSKGKVTEMQSEGGAAGAVHGALQAGTYATTFTASQGLLLMIPNIYKWVGEMLPAVIHVAARSLATRSLSIFGDHQDIYAVRQTGATMISSHSVQEVADLTPLAHLLAMTSSTPVIHFFDGFRTSHEIQHIEILEDEAWQKLIPHEAIKQFRSNALNPHGNAVTRGGAENGDIYFQGREAQNAHYNKVADHAKNLFNEVSKMTGRHYAPFTYYGHPEAQYVIVAMGSVTETIHEVVDTMVKYGQKVGMVKVHLYRPFLSEALASVLPKSVKRIAILDRTKEMGSTGEPLYVDVVSALNQVDRQVEKIIGGRYGLSSKDTQPKDIKGVFDFLANKPRHNFTISIKDDVTFLSVPSDENFSVVTDYRSCLFYGLGSDGTVSANKSSIKIIADATNQHVQAYFQYDSRKSGGVTRSHLRFGKSPIHSTYYIQDADFLSCSMDAYLYKFDVLKALKPGGVFLLNTAYTDEELTKRLPNRIKYQLANKNAKFYVIDANKIAQELDMGRHTNTILQSSFFFLNQDIMPYQDALEQMKDFAKKAYGKKGEDIIQKNIAAIDAGSSSLREVKIDPTWESLSPKWTRPETGDEYWDTFVQPMISMQGDDIPVSKFTEFGLLDGTMRNNITFKEQREIADKVPVWKKENCIQCNICSLVCPHATIRAFMMTPDEVKGAPEAVGKEAIDVMGPPSTKGLKYIIQVSPKNCVGCSICVVECPGKGPGKKALEMVDAKSQYYLEPAAQYLYKNIDYKPGHFPVTTPKGAGFLNPYMEVSGACAGCGETPYYRLATQLFGRDMLIANATGCTSIYSGSTPLTPFVSDKNNEGVAWANSLFEDNAEFGLGMRLATNQKLGVIEQILTDAKPRVEPTLQKLIDQYLENVKNRDVVRTFLHDLITEIRASKDEKIKAVLQYERDLLDKSVWIVGGDGWAYDIGYGGLDHVLASHEDVNILVLDTEVYSNTGGQSSKSSPMGSIAKFAASGKATGKKNLAAMAMQYGHVYVAQIALGANFVQTIKAMKEAEDYHDGPSIIIAYSPCIEHNIKGGLMNAALTEKKAVESGYFPIFRYDPRLVAQGKSPLQIDQKDPDFTKFRNFMMEETRYSALETVNPEFAQKLLIAGENLAKIRWDNLKKSI